MSRPAIDAGHAEVVARVTAFLGELGIRWGLPAEPCRIHGYLYLSAKPVDASEIADALALDHKTLQEALAWLKDFRLAERVGGSKWQTNGDPWELLLRALEERQRREVGPALALLRDCQRTVRATEGGVLRRQIGKLIELAQDFEAIGSQARRLSPAALRRMIGVGGRAARFLDRALGRSNT
jgi:DNA-binding transcriptional regulator GbsR (MarR family)